MGFALACAMVVGAVQRRLDDQPLGGRQWQASALSRLLMLGFELAIGRARGFGWARIVAEFDPHQDRAVLFGAALRRQP
jgi:hypothetical protein